MPEAEAAVGMRLAECLAAQVVQAVAEHIPRMGLQIPAAAGGGIRELIMVDLEDLGSSFYECQLLNILDQ